MSKCSECGYLGERILRYGIPQSIIEAEGEARETGILPHGNQTERELHSSPRPVCFANAAHLGTEIATLLEKAGKDPVTKDPNILKPFVLEVINKNRACTEWVKWQPGATPKEHREERRDKDQREWQANQERTNRRWRIIELLVFILAGAGTAIVAALIERGTLFSNGSPPLP